MHHRRAGYSYFRNLEPFDLSIHDVRHAFEEFPCEEKETALLTIEQAANEPDSPGSCLGVCRSHSFCSVLHLRQHSTKGFWTGEKEIT